MGRSAHKTDFGGGSVQRKQRILNGRGHANLNLDDASFELVSDCPTSLSTQDFYTLQREATSFSMMDVDAISKEQAKAHMSKGEALKQKYYREVSDFIKKKLRCDKVICFNHQVRNASKSGDGVAGYAGHGPHTDSSAVSGDEMALQTLSQLGLLDEEGKSHFKRYLYLNLWRNISENPIENDHLAVLDERSTAKPDDYIPKDLFGEGYNVVQYSLNARHADNHKWYYYPGMQKDEALLFKQMDSDFTKSGRVCFHMSINDENVKNVKHPRESIETRIMCFWKDAAIDSMPTKENLNPTLVKDPSELAGSTASLADASLWDIGSVVLGKLPLIGSWFRRGASSTGKVYSGKPQDYISKFTQVVDVYPSWPEFAKNWIKDTMQNARSKENGVETITEALVNDQMGYQGTKNFSSKEKAAIVECLLSDTDGYVKACEKHFYSVLEG